MESDDKHAVLQEFPKFMNTKPSFATYGHIESCRIPFRLLSVLVASRCPQSFSSLSNTYIVGSFLFIYILHVICILHKAISGDPAYGIADDPVCMGSGMSLCVLSACFWVCLYLPLLIVLFNGDCSGPLRTVQEQHTGCH